MTEYSADSENLTGRDMSSYKVDLGIKDVEILRGKHILDIGGGYGKFQEECNKLNIDVIALDPLYVKPTSDTNVLKEHLKNPENRKNKIASINETLPFKEKSFDIVLNNHASLYCLNWNYPDYETNRRMAKKMIGEIVRVLKNGGEARIAPIDENHGVGKGFFDSVIKEVSESSKSNISWNFFCEPNSDYIVLRKE